MRYDERKAADLHPLWITELGKKGGTKDENAWGEAPAAVQGLRPKVYAAASKADRAG